MAFLSPLGEALADALLREVLEGVEEAAGLAVLRSDFPALAGDAGFGTERLGERLAREGDALIDGTGLALSVGNLPVFLRS